MPKVTGVELIKAFNNYEKGTQGNIEDIIKMIATCSHTSFVSEVSYQILRNYSNKIDICVAYNLFSRLQNNIDEGTKLENMQTFCRDKRLSLKQKYGILDKFFIRYTLYTYKAENVFSKRFVLKYLKQKIEQRFNENNCFGATQFIAILCLETFSKLISKEQIFEKYKNYYNDDDNKCYFYKTIGYKSLDEKGKVELNKYLIQDAMSEFESYRFKDLMTEQKIPLSLIMETFLETITDKHISLSEQMKQEINGYEVYKKMTVGN